MSDEQYQYQYGDTVVFTDEVGQERVGTITSTCACDQEGLLAITGTYGWYVRKPGEVHLAQDWEVHQASIKKLQLDRTEDEQEQPS